MRAIKASFMDNIPTLPVVALLSHDWHLKTVRTLPKTERGSIRARFGQVNVQPMCRENVE